uniref:Uncharacterized protein n=1 Tax=Salix viminalis TaxID=40686 RepID=A0A6N2LEJ5_SALVM
MGELHATFKLDWVHVLCNYFLFFPASLFVAIHMHTNHINGRQLEISSCSRSNYAAYGPEYGYQQGVYNPYATGQQYLQMYGVPGAVNSGMYPYGQLSQNVPGGHGYTSIPGYALPGHQIVQFGGPSVNAITTSSMQQLQAPYHTGIAPAVPAQPHICKVAVLTKTLGEGLIKVIDSHAHQRSHSCPSRSDWVEKGCGKFFLLPWCIKNLCMLPELRTSNKQHEYFMDAGIGFWQPNYRNNKSVKRNQHRERSRVCKQFLELPAPSLVYEYAENGCLDRHVHNGSK